MRPFLLPLEIGGPLYALRPFGALLPDQMFFRRGYVLTKTGENEAALEGFTVNDRTPGVPVLCSVEPGLIVMMPCRHTGFDFIPMCKQ